MIEIDWAHGKLRTQNTNLRISKPKERNEYREDSSSIQKLFLGHLKLMNERGRLQCLTRWLLRHIGGGQLAKLAIKHRKQFGSRFRIALLDCPEDARDVVYEAILIFQETNRPGTASMNHHRPLPPDVRCPFDYPRNN
ncbi:MAG: hypothetical protein JWM99_3615 [Verrucomicrobiales bacterium]|nr:hypothetical protein [Verrucomicrobiales bacterium]